MSGRLTDRFGRRRAIMSAAVLYCIGGSERPWRQARNIWWLSGSCSALQSAVQRPSFLCTFRACSEGIPGRAFFIKSADDYDRILLSYLINYAFSDAGAWRWMLGLALIPSIGL
ncbi:hypothetical protein PO124_21665 [Bacillus licheniformis]|nr:hypothetical protein [Bacillus licheniformis]